MQDFEYQQDKAAANAERLESFQSFAQGLCQVVLCVVEPYLEDSAQSYSQVTHGL